MNIKIDFSAFYNENCNLEYYEIDDTKFIDFDNQKRIIDHIKKIYDSIEATNTDFGIEKEYVNILKKICSIDLFYQKSLFKKLENYINHISHCDRITYIISSELEIVPLILNEGEGLFGRGIRKYGICMVHKLQDYNKDQLRQLFKEKEEYKEDEEDEPEDKSVIEERRKLVLTFEHPEGFVKENGDYDYDECSSPCILKYATAELLALAKAYRLRYKTKEHFDKLDRIEYNFPEMKKSKKVLHSELKSFYKIFKRQIDNSYGYIPSAILVEPIKYLNA